MREKNRYQRNPWVWFCFVYAVNNHQQTNKLTKSRHTLFCSFDHVRPHMDSFSNEQCDRHVSKICQNKTAISTLFCWQFCFLRRKKNRPNISSYNNWLFVFSKKKIQLDHIFNKLSIERTLDWIDKCSVSCVYLQGWIIIK